MSCCCCCSNCSTILYHILLISVFPLLFLLQFYVSLSLFAFDVSSSSWSLLLILYTPMQRNVLGKKELSIVCEYRNASPTGFLGFNTLFFLFFVIKLFGIMAFLLSFYGNNVVCESMLIVNEKITNQL